MNDELLFVGKARKVGQRIKNHRDEVYRIDVCIVENPMERGFYETYMINEFQAKYNVNKVFYK
ncbi:excinuclease ABC subunit C [Bacillus wiedmannii]|nr:excinuclease ABC subunit C [Bacillus wiedmannii]